MIGSCFATNIGEKLEALKFDILLNPFGILFNPLSIAASLKRIVENKPFAEQELIFHHEMWHSLAHHGKFSHTDKTQCLENINSSLAEAHKRILKSKFLIMTFGTAWVYFYKKTGSVVANCHQLPSSEFDRQLISIEEVYTNVFDSLSLIKKVNPDIQFIFTVSPVRHLADGAHANQLSKATLLLAISQLCKTFGAQYFPAYEIILDELRDYRFFADDMAHPSPLAVDYVFERFAETYFNKETHQLNLRIDEINKAINHRPVNENSIAHGKFKEVMLKKIADVEKAHPHLDFSEKKRHFASFKNMLL
jgi:hypothetical protein